jgi:hypothetical protein
MKRPEQTSYLTPQKEFENFKTLIESKIEADIFEFDSDEWFDVDRTDIKDWLTEWGWEIKRHDPPLYEPNKVYYYVLTPIN